MRRVGRVSNKAFLTVKNFYFFIVLIFSGLATSFSRSNEGIIMIFLLSLLYIAYYNISLLNKKFIMLCAGWVMYSIITAFRNSEFLPFFTFRYLVYFLVAFTLIKLYNKKLFFLFEKSIYYLAIVSLFFLFFEIFSPSFIRSVTEPINIAGDLCSERFFYSNIIVKTFLWRSNVFLQRNAGFCWEPGPFSIFLVLATFFLYLRKPITFWKHNEFWIFIITILTTQSTTGVGTLLVLIIYLIFKRYKGDVKYFYLIFSLIIGVLIFIYTPFLYDKITKLIIMGKNIEEVIDRAANTGNSYSGGRFGGLVIALHNFIERPILGTGGYSSLSYGSVEDGNVYIVNGLALIITTFGLLGILFYLFFAYKSSVIISRLYKSNCFLGFFIIIILSSFGFGVHNMPILFSLILFSFFIDNSLISNNVYENNFFYRFSSLRR